MKKIYLIRHAQSKSNAGKCIRPNADINITKLGQGQAQTLSHWLGHHIDTPIDKVFVSPYVRTQQTAQPFLATLSDVPVEMIEPLHEFNYLAYDHIKDMSFSKLVKVSDEYWQRADKHFQANDSTESYVQFVGRVRQTRQIFADLPDGTYVVFGHGMWLGMLMWQLLHHDNEHRLMNMHAFRQFELLVRPKNCEVYLLTGDELAITKVRARGDED